MFGRDKSVTSRHLANIFKNNELEKNAVVANFATTAVDSKTYQVNHYNFDAIISLGYRVNSKEGIRFKKWSSEVLKKYLIDGYVLREKAPCRTWRQKIAMIYCFATKDTYFI